MSYLHGNISPVLMATLDTYMTYVLFVINYLLTSLVSLKFDFCIEFLFTQFSHHAQNMPSFYDDGGYNDSAGEGTHVRFRQNSACTLRGG